jgi:hypothetical protein
MHPGRTLLALSLVAVLAVPVFAAGSGKTRRTRTKTSTSAKHRAKSHTAAVQHQRAIDDARATEIQAALIRAGYLSGSPSGHWDAASIAAMTKLQSNNGWQTKLVPDSRALIKLGLGPTPPAPAAPAESVISATGSIPARP